MAVRLCRQLSRLRIRPTTRLDNYGRSRVRYQRVHLGGSFLLKQVDPPKYEQVPDETDILNSTIIMIIVKYKKNRFFRCSYLIRQFYQDEELALNPPDNIVWDKLFREIKTEKPIITLYDLVWDDNTLVIPGNINKGQFEGVDILGDTESQMGEQEERNQTLQQLIGGQDGKASVHSKMSHQSTHSHHSGVPHQNSH